MQKEFEHSWGKRHNDDDDNTDDDKNDDDDDDDDNNDDDEADDVKPARIDESSSLGVDLLSLPHCVQKHFACNDDDDDDDDNNYDADDDDDDDDDDDNSILTNAASLGDLPQRLLLRLQFLVNLVRILKWFNVTACDCV